MAINIGGKYSIDELDEEAWVRAAKDVGIGKGFALDRIQYLTARLKPALKEAAEELEAAGLPSARKIARRCIDR